MSNTEFNKGQFESNDTGFGNSLKKITAKLLIGASLASPLPAGAEKQPSIDKLNSQEVSMPVDNENEATSFGLSQRETDLMLVSSLTVNPLTETKTAPVELIEKLVNEKKELTLTKYQKELSENGCSPDYLEIASQWLNVVDNNNTGPFSFSGLVSENHEQVRDYIKREAVIDQSSKGDGLTLFEDGGNRAMLVNMEDKDVESFSMAVELLKAAGVEDPLSDLNQNGFNTFFLHKYDLGDYSWSSDGVINAHGDKQGRLSPEKATSALVEGGFATKLSILKDGAGVMIFGSYIDVLASRLAADNLDYLYKKGGETNLLIKVLATELREKSEIAMDKLGNIKDDDLHVKFLYQLITDNNLVKPLGTKDWGFTNE